MPKFKTKNKKNTTVIVVCSLLVVVIFCGVLWNVSDSLGFGKKLNEDNLLFGEYDDITTVDHSSGLTFTNKNGVIVIDGKIADSPTASDAVWTFAEITLDAGQYTYTCFEKPSVYKYYSFISWVDDEGNTYVVYGDVDNLNIVQQGVTVAGYETFTLDEKTEVKFNILVCPGVEMDGVKAMPCIVEGKSVGSFYATK
ncbi:MAG: hypothetical protein IKJ07_07830 [Clostridia bacterium]|nr:hypothetical protein [Clostridia bacterium]